MSHLLSVIDFFNLGRYYLEMYVYDFRVILISNIPWENTNPKQHT